MANAGSTDRPRAGTGGPTRPANLRQAQREATRKLLTEAAAELFRNQGYAATSVDDIARAAGATRATFYLHFKDKAEVIRELVDILSAERAEFNQVLSAMVQAGDRASVRSYLDRAFDFWERVASIAKAEEEAAALHPQVQHAQERGFDHGVDAIAAGLQAAGRFDEMGRRVRGVLAYTQLTNLFRRWLRVGWDVDRTEMLEIMTDMWLCAFQAEHGSAGAKPGAATRPGR